MRYSSIVFTEEIWSNREQQLKVRSQQGEILQKILHIYEYEVVGGSEGKNERDKGGD